MIIRRLNSNEMYKADLVDSVAFEGDINYDSKKAECLNAAPNHVCDCDIVWASLDDDQNVAAKIEVVPLDVRFEGGVVKMGGIGGVATLPAFRRMGLIRECMRSALSEMNDSGYVLSSLYPFSRAYYRQFGYENFADICSWSVDFSALKKYPDVGGKIRLLLPEDDLSALDRVYAKAFADVNHSTVREKYRKSLVGAKRFSEKRYVYVWYDDSDEPRGFMIFKNDNGAMNCLSGWAGNDFVFCDAAAFKALLNFASGMFAPRYHAIKFNLPDSIPLNIIISEMNSVECSKRPNGMTRVVNVEKALKMCRCKGSGKLKLKISDGFCPWNDGVWSLAFSDGAENQTGRCGASESPDISLDIRSFTTLICGINQIADAPFMPDVEILNPTAPLENVFYKKTNILTNCF